MAGGGGGGDGGANRSLQETPTWALATVCFIFIFLGIFVEHLIHLAGHWLKKHKKTALYEAIEKLKSVLMQLGFMSLILTVTQGSISKICITNSAADYMLPCRSQSQTKTTQHLLFSNLNKPQFQPHHHRILLADSPSNSSDYCGSKGKTSLMSVEGMNQLNIFIFVLAAMQIVYSLATMGLGRAKMKRWKSWEKETQTIEYITANDPERFRYTRQTTFGRRHMSSFATNSAHLWIVSINVFFDNSSSLWQKSTTSLYAMDLFRLVLFYFILFYFILFYFYCFYFFFVFFYFFCLLISNDIVYQDVQLDTCVGGLEN
ncbi:hypothetical protein SASPL_122504 [Salvia splendens]|uniref:MLO-like protein n=1 Tax=Salvia splendens TaxID=180675 RepID=A0A8X8XLQ5_SALSN|nr:hypothetical protein SASPL_122504 [Salvia splendens]